MSQSRNHEAYPFVVTVGGSTFTQRDPNGLDYLEIEEHVDMIGVAELAVNLEHTQWGNFEVGDEFVAEVGNSSRKMFSGVVTGVRHQWRRGRQLAIIQAMDPLCKASASRRTQIYEEMTDSDIVQQVIGMAGLEAGQVDSTTEVRPYVLQRTESDLDFMKRLAARNNYMLRCAQGKVDFVKPQFSGQAHEVPEDVLESMDYNYNALNVPPEITTSGWDYAAAERVEGSAGEGDIEPIGSGRSAMSVAGRLWGDQKNTIADVDVAAQGGAKDIAAAEMNRLARNFLRGRAAVDGDANIHAGALIKFTGHREGFNAEVYVISARHRFAFKRGYRTEFTFCSNTFPV